MTYKSMKRRAIARGVIDGVSESLTGRPFFSKPEQKGPRSLRGRRTRAQPVRPHKWLK